MKTISIAIAVLILVVLPWSALVVSPVYALNTPQIVSVNPPSGSSVGSTVCIRAKIQWDDEFRAMRIRFGNEGWQESAEVEFERCFVTGHLSSGWYTIRVEAARKGDNSWSSPTVTETNYELTASAQPTPTPTTSTPPKGPAITEVSFNPSGGAQVGTTVGIHIKVDSSSPGAIRIFVPCGGVAHFEHTVPEYDTTWNTDTCGAGEQTVRVCTRHKNDPNWENATCTERSYSLSSPPADAPSASFWADTGSIQQGQCTWLHWSTSNATTVDIDGSVVSASGNMKVCPTVTKHYSLKAIGPGGTATRSLSITVSAAISTDVPDYSGYFSTGDVIQIGYDVFVMLNGQRRLVPNPDTLDALGIPRSWIDNKGLSDFQLKTITRGPDIPDVNRDPAGFDAFKARYFPNTTPIVPATATPRELVLQPTPTSTPRPTTRSGLGEEQQPSIGGLPMGWDPGTDPSVGGGTINIFGFEIRLPSFEVRAGSAQDLFLKNQCTRFVAGKRPDVAQWIGDRPRHAKFWDNRAQANGGPPVDKKPRKGDIAVWEAGCGGAPADPNNICNPPSHLACGHVAYVIRASTDRTKIWVEEANWNTDRSGQAIDVLPCMSFIHEPGSAASDSHVGDRPAQEGSGTEGRICPSWLPGLFCGIYDFIFGGG